MNGKLEQVSAAMLEGMLPPMVPAERDMTMKLAQLSRPLMVGSWDGELLCIFGLIPQSLLSDEAYLWLYDTPGVRAHRVAFARHAIRLMADLRHRYTRITGHCFTEDSWRWLQRLGATATSPQTFEIITWPHH